MNDPATIHPIMGLDPSSTRIGFALLGSQETLLDCGYISPKRKKDRPAVRVSEMLSDLDRLLNRWRPGVMVIEMPSQHVQTGRHKGRGAGLALYGFGVGAVWIWCRGRAEQWSAAASDDHKVVTVDPETWTRGIPKYKRTAEIAAMFPQYAAALKQGSRDSGGDAADAIGLALWWWQISKAVGNGTPLPMGCAIAKASVTRK